MNTLIRITLFIALMAPVTSCSFIDRFGGYHPADASNEQEGGTDASNDASTELTLETFVPLFFNGLCAKSIRCEEKSGLGSLFQIFCNSNVKSIYLQALFGDLQGFEATIAQQCLVGLASIDCSASNTLFVSECETFLRGSAATGQACQTDFTCASGRCKELPNTCGEVCVDAGNLGDACVDAMGDSQCDAPMRCRQGMCQLAGEIGQGCEKITDCIPLTWCTGGTCQALPNAGDTCVVDGTTQYADPCRGSLVCTADADGGFTRSCQPGKTAGQSCSSSTPCAPGHRCRSGTCHVVSPPGGPCVSLDDCPWRFECVAEICVPYAPLGGACSPTLPCFQGACVSNVCVLLPNGSTCDGTNGILGGQCMGYCQYMPTGSMCVALGGVGSTCDYNESCQQGLGCMDMGGTKTCQTCN